MCEEFKETNNVIANYLKKKHIGNPEETKVSKHLSHMQK